jgi:hypothetical protein
VLYNNQVVTTVDGILPHTAKDIWLTQSIILFIHHTIQPTEFPRKKPTNGIHENATRPISAKVLLRTKAGQ